MKQEYIVYLIREKYDGFDKRRFSLFAHSLTDAAKTVKKEYHLEDCIDWKLRIKEA